MTTTRRRARTALALSATAAAALALSGCGSLESVVHRESSSTYDDAAQLASDWGKTAPWLPVDASDISIRESTQGDPASLVAVSGSALDPAQCAEVDRQSAPTFALDGAPDVYSFDRVWACGDWAVVPTDDGWYGWTPNDPDEKAASPAG
jgi:hypothetical protein